MTAFRRLITIGCLSLAPFALGQQTPATQQMQTTTATESEAKRQTEPVTADTDKDLTDPRAMPLVGAARPASGSSCSGCPRRIPPGRSTG